MRPPATDPALALVDSVASAIRAHHAPDRRTARFDVTVARDGGGSLVVTGETTSEPALAAFRAALRERGVEWRDGVLLLPDPALFEARWAVANNSVANLRTTPGHSSELSTQALLGTPLRVLRRDNGFYLVQAPDGYLSWVDGGGIELMSESAFRRYRGAPKIIFTRTAGAAYSAPDRAAEPVADLVLGGILEVVADGPAGGWYAARMPDGRRAFVPADDAVPYDAWADDVRATEEGLVLTSRTLLGAPYLWGGTSAKGMDCSGFTKTVYFMHGLILPRDASQQVHSGSLVDDAGEFGRLRPGDLLFFGRPASGDAPERVVHVAMWIGDGRFIHASGRVMINSMDPAAPDYDDYNRRRYLRTKRVLGSDAGVRALRGGGLYDF